MFDTLSNYDISAIAYTLSDIATHEGETRFTKSLCFSLWGPGNDKLKILMNHISDRALNCIERLSVQSADNVSITDLEALPNKLKLIKMRITRNPIE